jgi:hypothetical protein
VTLEVTLSGADHLLRQLALPFPQPTLAELGGRARAAKLTPEERSASALKGGECAVAAEAGGRSEQRQEAEA